VDITRRFKIMSESESRSESDLVLATTLIVGAGPAGSGLFFYARAKGLLHQLLSCAEHQEEEEEEEEEEEHEDNEEEKEEGKYELHVRETETKETNTDPHSSTLRGADGKRTVVGDGFLQETHRHGNNTSRQVTIKKKIASLSHPAPSTGEEKEKEKEQEQGKGKDTTNDDDTIDAMISEKSSSVSTSWWDEGRQEAERQVSTDSDSYLNLFAVNKKNTSSSK